MKSIKQLLKERYHLTNYQIAQLTFLGKTFSSEASKLLIMGILFHKQLKHYFFALFIMLILRCFTGGLHCSTYFGCFITSTLFLWFAIILLPNIAISLNTKIFLLLIGMLICYYIGPIPSKYRPPFNDDFIKKCKSISSGFIFFYTLLLYIMPNSKYFIIGFWVIILHSLQLFIAKYTRKEPA